MAIIALLTDFGTRDWFAAEMKAVIYSISPQSTVIDITHQIDPGDTRAAAFALLACFKSFPSGTIFCTVVDPDTGIDSRPVIFQGENYFLTGPDNGVLSWICQAENIIAVYQLNCENGYVKTPQCATFYGRDLIAPAAAQISKGVIPEMFGSRISDYRRLPFPEVKISKNQICGQIIYLDRFGNAITNIRSDLIDNKSQKQLVTKIHGKFLTLPVRRCYKEVPLQSGLAYMGSAGFIEIGINGGNAARDFQLLLGDSVEIINTASIDPVN
jgi:S-adenosylmethionine hydrolase